MSFDHAAARRSASDSLVWVVRAEDRLGVGEAVVRDYVSGTRSDPDPLETARADTAGFIGDVLGRTVSLEALRVLAADDSVPAERLPAICGLETALLDLLCSVDRRDVYDLLGCEPVRNEVVYGGIVPMLPAARRLEILGMYRDLGIGNLRLKVARDAEQAFATVDSARGLFGDGFDLRVDANGSWDIETARRIIPGLLERGVSIVEEPVGRDREAQRRLAAEYRSVEFVADESVRTVSDLDRIVSDRSFGMVNIRLSKNGGLLRSLRLARLAAERGLRYQLGCHVGETGVLSAAGRVAASLMSRPVYSDGSFDRYLLTGNITRTDVSFGAGGRAPVLRGEGLGYRAELSRIEEWSVGHVECI